jgi:hypothetical protein
MSRLKKVHSTTTSTKIRNRLQLGRGANVASAATITLGNDGNVFLLTGTTAIDYITITGWEAGAIVHLLFGSSITLNHASSSPVAGTSAALSLTSAANVSATDKDVVSLIYDGTVWRSMHAISAI